MYFSPNQNLYERKLLCYTSSLELQHSSYTHFWVSLFRTNRFSSEVSLLVFLLCFWYGICFFQNVCSDFFGTMIGIPKHLKGDHHVIHHHWNCSTHHIPTLEYCCNSRKSDFHQKYHCQYSWYGICFFHRVCSDFFGTMIGIPKHLKGR